MPLLLPDLSSADFLPMLPAIVLVVGACVLLLSEVFLSTTARGYQVLVAAASGILASLISVGLIFEEPRLVFLGYATLDPFSSFLTLLVSASLVLAVLLTQGFLVNRKAERGEFYALMLFSTAGMSLLALTNELITLFVNLEVMSIATYALTSYLRRGTRPSEAGFKYFILGAFSSAVLLYGAALLYGATGTTILSEMAQGDVLRTAFAEQPALVLIASLLIGAGFAFKIAAVPFHMWTPDVYEGAPTPVTALMSAGVKAAAFAAMIRVFMAIAPSVDPKLPVMLFAGLALVTMVIGNLLAIPQRNVKRMLAYSSIAHAGYLLLGVAALFASGHASEVTGLLSASPLLGGADAAVLRSDALRGILFYLLAYSVTAIGAFGIVAALERKEDEEKGTAWDLERFSGLAQRRPGWALMMAIFMLSLGGIPPTVGFMGKLLIFRSAVDAGLVWLAVVGVLASVAGVYYYLRVVVYMYMRPIPEPEHALHRSWSTETALVFSSILVVLLGILPGPVTGWLQQAGLVFLGQ